MLPFLPQRLGPPSRIMFDWRGIGPQELRVGKEISNLALSVRVPRKTCNEVVAVKAFDLDVRHGECFGLLGPNGAGKTTTIEICEGLTEPHSGDVVVLGMTWAADARGRRGDGATDRQGSSVHGARPRW